MRVGAFALLDCLGFKGIWRRRSTKPEELLEFLFATKRSANSDLRIAQTISGVHGDKVELKFAFISDTVAVSALYKEGYKPPPSDEGFLVSVVAASCGEVQKRFLQAPTPLALRGCITYGEHVVIDAFFAGPAVDDAASLGEIAQGAFMWLTPDAANVLRRFHRAFPELMRNTVGLNLEQRAARADEIIRRMIVVFPGPQADLLNQGWSRIPLDLKQSALESMTQAYLAILGNHGILHDYSMPIKAGAPLRCDLVSPLLLQHPNKFSTIMEIYLRTFDTSSVDVLLKRQNTETLLNFASQSGIDASKKAQADGMAAVIQWMQEWSKRAKGGKST
jgi:hypothetical protein